MDILQASTNHKIRILNYVNGETVSYSIVKITGSVQNSENCQNSPKNNVRICANNKNSTTQLVGNKFKFLFQLTDGENDFIIQFCCEQESFTLSYDNLHSDYSVIPLYVICEGHDGRFQAPDDEHNSIESACNRITVCSKLLQLVTAEKLHEHDLGRKTFKMEECQIFHSNLNYLKARNMQQVELWEYIGREIRISNIGCDKRKYLAFLSCTVYCGDKYEKTLKSHEDFLGITEGYVALGGGGLALFGTACLYTWPENFDEIITRFTDCRQVERSLFLDDSCYRGTLGACFSTTLGSVLHELYHTFDLGHTEEGIMGRGFDNIYKVFVEGESNDANKNKEQTSTYQDKIEFQEELESESLLERIMAEKRRKEFTVIKKDEEIDDTVLTKSCAVLLCYHKWFNESCAKLQKCTLSFDSVNKLIKSTAGIRVIEIRSIEKEYVLHHWVFVGRILKFSFQIPEDIIKKCCGNNYLLVAEDSNGCILKNDIEF